MSNMLGFGIYPARIAGVYGANTYHVVGPYFDDIATYFGEGEGHMGARRSGGLSVGATVIVAMGEGDTALRIIAVDQRQTNLASDVYNARLLTAPEDQVSGYRRDSFARRVIDGNLHTGLREHRNDGFQDLVNGEWGMVSYFGAAVLVEYYRAALRAGHFSELAFYTDDQLGRLRAMKWEHDTLFTETRDTFYGNFPERSERRFWTAAEATSETALPRGIENAGPGHLGSHSITAAPGEPGTPRRGISYDYTDQGGMRVIGAAGGLVLERRIDLDVPEEQDPEDRDALQEQYEAAVAEPREEITFAGDLTTLVHAQSALDVIDAVTSYRSRNATDTVTERWVEQRLEPQDHLVQQDGSMWGSLPQVVEVVLDAGPKEFYVGRSLVALLPDGNILVENAHGAQIMAAGPNLVLSAPGDIIEICGGTKQTLASKSIVLRAYEHLQAVANTGRVDLKAEQQFSILGGNQGGNEGVLIESRAEAPESVTGVGADSKMSGVVLRSRSGIYAAADGDLGLAAKGNLVVRAEDGQFYIDAPAVAAKVAQSLQIFTDSDRPLVDIIFDGDNPGQVQFGGDVITRRNFVSQGSAQIQDQLVVGGSAFVGGALGAGSQPGQIDAAGQRQIDQAIRAVDQAVAFYDDRAADNRRLLQQLVNADTPLTSDKAAAFGFSFFRSIDYNLPGNFAYALPETRWHQRSQSGETWEESQVLDPTGNEVTQPYPGFTTWTNQGKYLKAADGLYFDAATAKSTLSQPGDDPGAEITVAQSTPLSQLVRTP